MRDRSNYYCKHYFINSSHIPQKISLKKNPNFSQWIQVFSFGRVVEEDQGKAEALRVAKRIAKENKLDYINSFGKVEYLKK